MCVCVCVCVYKQCMRVVQTYKPQHIIYRIIPLVHYNCLNKRRPLPGLMTGL